MTSVIFTVTRLTIQNVVQDRKVEAGGEVPKDVYKKCAEDGLLGHIAGSKSIPRE